MWLYFCACFAFLLHLHVAVLLILYHSVHHQNTQKLKLNFSICIFMIEQRVNISVSLFNLTISYFNNYSKPSNKHKFRLLLLPRTTGRGLKFVHLATAGGGRGTEMVSNWKRPFKNVFPDFPVQSRTEHCVDWFVRRRETWNASV